MQHPSGWVLATVLSFTAPCLAAANPGWQILTAPSSAPDCVTIAGNGRAAAIVVDTNDDAVVQLAANFFSDDVQRVTGQRPVVTNAPAGASQVVIAGTLGHSTVIDTLAGGGKLKDLDQIRGRWEATLCQVVEDPLPGVERAVVIAGSDRRGTAYGLMRLSEAIGVSPWYWWADVPAQHHDAVAVKISAPQVDAPAVKYRGFFINDEDWGLNPWASKTFDPQFGNIGPKTYERVFELMLRLRLNYLWPAMHAVSTEFGSVPENAALANEYGIVMGSSHCEPMLFNNVHWNERTRGRWNYSLNQSNIFSIWEDTARARGQYEAVWTLGIRGIHDAGMETPPNDMPGKINLMEKVFSDQRELLNDDVTRQWGPVAQCFVPYKEVLPIYDAGLKVPDNVTLVWVDDNFGYIRRLSNPAERKRSGGAGVYWRLSYYGGPHSYTWINTTAPALMWEELHKAWQNDARTLWVINVGDIKPAELGIDYFSRFAWNPDGFPLGGQRKFLQDFAGKNFGATFAQPLTDLLMDFYRLGTVRKPELMDRSWALSLRPERAAQLERDYKNLLWREQWFLHRMPARARDAYTEMIGFPARVLGDSGLIFMADRKIQETNDVAANENEIAQLRSDLEMQVTNYNTKVAGGKWNRVMPGLVTGRDLMSWSSQVRWPWGERTSTSANRTRAYSDQPPAGQSWRDAATADHQTSSGSARWAVIEGLGPSGRAMALEPASLDSSWNENDAKAPTFEYNFTSKAGDAEAFVDFLPTFRIYPGMKLRVAVSVDNQPATLVEVPGSSGAENENGAIRSDGVQNNYTRARIPLP
ncbi:MAG TPA: glycosyl hydrolase 115 family protein, partial [Verrucomicrobiae bacterium]|nr:glycosyl hydrolase 115 family protein [Verrucomicrobiae bacterium]